MSEDRSASCLSSAACFVISPVVCAWHGLVLAGHFAVEPFPFQEESLLK